MSLTTHDLGRLFCCTIPLTANAPIVHTAPMTQARWPFWNGPTIIIRLKRGRGLVLGWWRKPRHVNEHDMLLRALRGRDLSERQPKYTGERTEGCHLPGTLLTSGAHYGLVEEINA